MLISFEDLSWSKICSVQLRQHSTYDSAEKYDILPNSVGDNRNQADRWSAGMLTHQKR